MPRTEEQFEGIRSQRKHQIMATALELFAHEGYYTTAISRIAEKAGISKGLMYNYFQSKDDLILAIIDDGFQKLLNSFDPNRDGVLTEDEFEFMVNRSFYILEQNTDYWKLYFSILVQPAVYKLVSVKYAEILLTMTSVIQGYYERKGVEDPRAEAQLFGAVLDGVGINFIMNPDTFPLKKIKELIIKRFK